MFEISIFCVILLAISYWAVLWVMGRREDVLHGEFVEAGARAEEPVRSVFPDRPAVPERAVRPVFPDRPVIADKPVIARKPVQAAITEYDLKNVKAVKLTTRCGMGLCQGRVCGPVVSAFTASLTGRDPAEVGSFSNRPIVWPVPLGELAR